MHVRRCFRTGLLALMVGLLQPLAAPSLLAGDDYAMQMPNAERSTLLDIATAGDRLVAVGERGHILFSDDRGASWTQAKVPTSVMLTRVFFVDAEQGWAVGHDGNILYSTDGGINWTLQRDGLSEQLTINEERLGRARERLAELERELEAAADDEDTEELEFELGEAEWAVESGLERLDAPVFAAPLMDVCFTDDQNGWAVGAYGALLRTRNGGRDWADWSYKTGNSEELHFNGVTADADGTVYIASEWGTVYRSQSGGEHWEALESGYEGSFFGVLTNPASGSVFAYGLLGSVYRSQDGGESWEELESRARASLFGGLAASDGSVVFVGQGGTVVRSTDDGDSFAPIAQANRKGVHGVTELNGTLYGAGEGGARDLEQHSKAVNSSAEGK